MGVARFVARRAMLALPVIIGSTVLVFLISHVIVDDPARVWAGPKASESAIEAIRIRYHLNEPLHLQYFYYFSGLVRGDWGISTTNNQNVLNNIANYLPATLELVTTATLITLILGILLGTVSAVRQNKPTDHAIRFFSLAGASSPPFLVGLILELIFFYYLGWFPSQGRIDANLDPPTRITGFFTIDSLLTANWPVLQSTILHLILPASTLALLSTGIVTRLIRSSMLEVLRSDYIRTAWSKGLEERVVVYKHALRNALIPAVTVVAFTFAYMLSGSIVVEYIFSFPGIGRYAAQSILFLDFPSMIGTVLVFTLAVVICNLVADILYAVLDPRIRLG